MITDNSQGLQAFRTLRDWAIDLAILVGATAGTYFAQNQERPITAVLVYLTGVIVVGARSGQHRGVVAALIASFFYNFFLSEPVFRFGMTSADEVVPLIAFNLSAFFSGALAGRLKDSAHQAHLAESRIAFLLRLSDELQQAISLSQVIELARRLLPEQGIAEVEVYLSREGRLFAADKPGEPLDPVDVLAADGSANGGRNRYRIYSLQGSSEEFGLVKFTIGDDHAGAGAIPDLQSVSNLLALAVDRCLLLEKLSESRAMQRSEELKTAILSSVSHDLRTPLTAIAAAATSLRTYRDTLSADQKDEMLAAIAAQTQKLNRYTANLLDMGRIQAGISPSQFSNVDLLDIVGVALTSIRQRFPNQAIEKDIGLAEAVVKANAVMLEQLVVNLLENAILHGGADSPISLILREKDSRCIMDIVDRGPGISRAEQSRVFDRFYRGRNPVKGDGSGLGLYIAKGFAEAFGGRIVLESPVEKSRGTKVSVQLPLAGPRELEEVRSG